jgi:hypothetical protein
LKVENVEVLFGSEDPELFGRQAISILLFAINGEIN